MARGRFVVFEGIEGSGKTTQAKLFYEELLRRGEKCILTAEPTKMAIGTLIREMLKRGSPVDIRTLQLLFIADRSEHLEGLIKPKLDEGYTVIIDRYSPSTISYGSALGKKHGLKMSYLINAHKPFLAPDLLFFISVPPKLAFERVLARNAAAERFDELDSMVLLEKTYEKLSKKYYPDRWRKVDGSKKVEEIKADILSIWDEHQRQ